ncbi:hypothetical protein C0J52_11835 [Blattella germanica]|nr:hypothetical protein C0J52_11835 [Blattella germanica]
MVFFLKFLKQPSAPEARFQLGPCSSEHMPQNSLDHLFKLMSYKVYTVYHVIIYNARAKNTPSLNNTIQQQY